VEPRGAICQDQFEDGFCAFREPFDASGDDGSAGGRRFAATKVGNRLKSPAVFVTARTMKQQVFDSQDFEPGQLSGSLRPNAG
jgi:hypothetical protein